MGGIMLINEIFSSIDGEVNHFGQGRFSTFIRLQGCNLQCLWCDSLKARNKDEFSYEMTPGEVFKKVSEFNCNKITITGGEPLEQRKGLRRLLEMFYSKPQFDLTIETNGSKSLSDISYMASWVVDYKLASSGMQREMNPDAFKQLTAKDTVKFVIQNKEDVFVAFDFMGENFPNKSASGNSDYPTFAFGPVYKKLSPKKLVEWIKESQLTKHYKIALNIQLHKFLDLP